jgi:hypothetical protein
MKYLNVPQSGSQAADTASRNRYGQYYRSRATPVNPNSTAQGTARARLAAASAAWRGLDDATRAGWIALGNLMTRTDSLGQTYTLSGFQAYVSVNSNRALVGDAALDDAPALATPEAIATVTPTVTDAAFSVAWTPTPLGTGERMLLFASPPRSAGRGFEGDYRFIKASSAAGTSPLDAATEYAAKFGVQVPGNRVFIRCFRYSGGFLSGPYSTSEIVG